MARPDPDRFAVCIGDPAGAEALIAQAIERFDVADIDLRIVHAGEMETAAVVRELDFLPVLSQKRVVVFRNAGAVSKADWEPLLAYLENPFPHAYLVIVGDDTKVSLRKYAPRAPEPQWTPERELFSAMYRMHRAGRGDLFRELHGFLRRKERAFPVVVAAMETYLRVRTQREGRMTPAAARRFSLLHEMDTAVKSGRIADDAGIELFLVSLLD